MQSKISSFFKPCYSSAVKSDQVAPLVCKDNDGDDQLALWENAQHQFVNTYKRRASKLDKSEKSAEAREEQAGDTSTRSISMDHRFKPESTGSGKVLNKKRSYAQFHLDLGQSDFNLRTCDVCGVKYAPGEEVDEKEHRTFHKNYTQGVRYKGCQRECVIPVSCNKEGCIILVQDGDSISQRKKVQEVIKMMEIELGEGWIFHKHCKVYLFISSQRVAGCLVAEPIKEAFRVITSSEEKKPDISKAKSKLNSTTLRFGDIMLQREVIRKVQSANSLERFNGNHYGAIVCTEDSSPAVCGIRAIWVTPSNRRKHIASQLIDAARRSFYSGTNLEISEIAFSPPTSAGNVLASNYTGTASFMVYKPQALDG